jgi:hypothetical protein
MADIPRCSECGAYINCYSGLDSIGWRCSVCGAYSEYVQNQIRKYSKPAIRETQPELQRHVYEALCPSYDSQSVREGVCLQGGCLQLFDADADLLKEPLSHVPCAPCLVVG